ncbi:MAG: lipoprotein insertase outer membrane protein LolB [Gammaproteobacteria bacterium]|nr:MAG: lipoprotein insertase outer membrane protein LolB [Gammaproteobacteria bacterium]
MPRAAFTLPPVIARVLLLISLALILPACTTAPESLRRHSALWPARQQALTGLQSWRLQGRLALKSEDEGIQLGLRWQRQGPHHRIHLFGPLGSGQARLELNEAGAVLWDGKGQRHEGESGQELLYRVTGWLLPVDALVYWVRGLPWPGLPSWARWDAQGRLRELTQDDWNVSYQKYQQFQQYELPTSVRILRQANDDVTELEVRLVVDLWQPNVAMAGKHD